MQAMQPAFMFGFGHLAPKPLVVSAETETLATLFYRNRKQAETAFPSVPKPNFGRSLAQCWQEQHIATPYYSGQYSPNQLHNFSENRDNRSLYFETNH